MEANSEAVSFSLRVRRFATYTECTSLHHGLGGRGPSFADAVNRGRVSYDPGEYGGDGDHVGRPGFG